MEKQLIKYCLNKYTGLNDFSEPDRSGFIKTSDVLPANTNEVVFGFSSL